MSKKNRSKSLSSEEDIHEKLGILMPPANNTGSRDLLESDIPSTISVYNAAETVESDIHHFSLTADHLPSNNLLHHLPPILVFFRGGIYLHEAWLILKNDERYQRMTEDEKKLRLLAALTGAIVSIGGSVVSLLLALHIGLLATAIAVTVTPIVLSSVSIAFFCMTLFRDLYRISEINKNLDSITRIGAKDRGYKVQEYRNLKSEKNEIIRNIFFGSIGTAATITFLLALSIPAATLCWATAIGLTVVAVSPALVSLAQKGWHILMKLFTDPTSSQKNQSDPTPSPLVNALALDPPKKPTKKRILDDEKQLTLDPNQNPSLNHAFFEKEQLHSLPVDTDKKQNTPEKRH